MPLNNQLKPKKFPMPICFGEKPETEFVNNLENIKVTLVQAPSMEEVKKYSIPFANATWPDYPVLRKPATDKKGIHEEDLVMYHIFAGKILPTTMETIRCNFLIEGISLQEVTHILRYRRAVFSAECSGDKWNHKKNMVVPTAIQQSESFYERYRRICEAAKQLYVDMIDSKEITAQDARYVLPRAMETYYFMSMSLKDAIQFVWDRIDKQIQPQSDNVIAYRMMCALVKQWPILVKVLSPKYLHQASKFYVATARQYRSTNWYCPDADSDVFEYTDKDFVYGLKKRDDFLGTDTFTWDVFGDILRETEEYLNMVEKGVDATYGADFFKQDIPEYFMNPDA